jgi:hypothetical protein
MTTLNSTIEEFVNYSLEQATTEEILSELNVPETEATHEELVQIMKRYFDDMMMDALFILEDKK